MGSFGVVTSSSGVILGFSVGSLGVITSSSGVPLGFSVGSLGVSTSSSGMIFSGSPGTSSSGDDPPKPVPHKSGPVGNSPYLVPMAPPWTNVSPSPIIGNPCGCRGGNPGGGPLGIPMEPVG